MTVDLSGRTLLNKYRIERLLGQGGMGSVWQGVHTLTGRKIAIKMLDDRFLGNLNVVQRFGREARAASAIHHEGIVEVLDLDQTEDGKPFLVMEYLEGELLSRRIDRRGKLLRDELVHIGSRLLDALHAAHQSGVVHRDLKPDNIFLVPGGRRGELVKILDFGISSKDDETQAKLTVTGSVLGTPHYMSPEQAMGDANLDRRVDIYGAAVVLYECSVGDVPYDGANYNKLLRVILDAEAVPPTQRGADLPEALEEVILKGMAKRREDRFATALEFKTAFDDAAVARQRVRVEARATGSEDSVVARWMATPLAGTSEPRRADSPSGEGLRADLASEPPTGRRPRAAASLPPPSGGLGALDEDLDAPAKPLEFDENALASVRSSSSGRLQSPLLENGEGERADSTRSRTPTASSRSSGRFPAVREPPPLQAHRSLPPPPPEEAEQAPPPPAWIGWVVRGGLALGVFIAVVFALRFAVRGGGMPEEEPDTSTMTAAPLSDGRSGPDWVSIDLDGVPPDALLRLDGLPGASAPLRVRRGSHHVLEIAAPGYVVRQIQIQADANQRVRADLRPMVGTTQRP